MSDLSQKLIPIGNDSILRYWQEMVLLAHGRVPNWRRMPFAMVNAYFDASGSHAGSRLLVFGGMLSTAEVCAQIEAEWKTILLKYGLDRWHATECVAGDGKFRGKSFAERLAIFGDFVTVLADKDILHLMSIVSMDDWSALSDEDRTSLISAWDVGFRSTLEQSIQWSDRCANGEKIAFAFDYEDRPISHRALDSYADYRQIEQWSRSMASLVFESSKVCVALQCADLFAYGLYRNALAQDFPSAIHDDFPVVPIFQRLMKDIPGGGGIFRKSGLERMAADRRAENG